ncbi:hypothetical protein NQ317_006448 [Molorchus minor]|uniref:ZAD domain-containing protein n=1 Tax=Molorchus minor TaxID=1323400 RepID=A0ABQ9IV20_9CUCU|nr:hypothetical protein NQ317_006448 [Molorchus minor]
MNICRLCLGEDKNLIQITEKKDLLLKIKDCVSVEIKADDNTKSVCNLCIQKVENWHSFKQMCINSDIQLKEIQLKETKTANFDEKATNSLTEIWSGDDDVKSCISDYELTIN